MLREGPRIHGATIRAQGTGNRTGDTGADGPAARLPRRLGGNSEQVSFPEVPLAAAESTHPAPHENHAADYEPAKYCPGQSPAVPARWPRSSPVPARPGQADRPSAAPTAPLVAVLLDLAGRGGPQVALQQRVQLGSDLAAEPGHVRLGRVVE